MTRKDPCPLWYTGIIVFACISILLAGKKLDESIFFSGDAGTDEKVIQRMLDSDSGGIAGPGGLMRGYIKYRIVNTSKKSIEAEVKRIVDELERRYKLYLNKHTQNDVYGRVKIQFSTLGSGKINNFKVVSTTLDDKQIETDLRGCFEEAQFNNSDTTKIYILQLDYHSEEE